jgi:hypothetical protein
VLAEPGGRRGADGGVTEEEVNGNGRIDFADVVWLFNHL